MPAASLSTSAALADAAPSVDMRSDTVTRPTARMYECMRQAPIGDDGLDGDPSTLALEGSVAALLGKEAGLFVPSCTMANLLAVLATGGRSEQVVLEAASHMYVTERGAGTFTGMFYQPVAGTSGAMDLAMLEAALKPAGHRLATALIAVETSHNNAGGAVLPLDHLQAVQAIAQRRGIPVHLDGARLFNASAALQVEPAAIARFADTVSVCLSKGLSAPVGAVLTGPQATLARARTLRRMLGGTQRQSGIMAAAGLDAVLHMRERLVDDHARARRFSDALNATGLPVHAALPQTNIVQVDVSASGLGSHAWVAALEAAGLRVRPWGEALLRCVTHRHIEEAEVDRAVTAFRQAALALV
jgi:threonine aldolase